MSYLRYLCLLVHSGVQHILGFVCLCLACHIVPVSLDCSFRIALRVSLTFIEVVLHVIADISLMSAMMFGIFANLS